ncbi:E3 ubiquitin-protein ligase listerin [Pectinophora gossypiella]|uniref:E3 ubiquitin-protein ligase listerin n=1 Tax=Pectinophora gossypiella TaxID=13191 RepID=UPI00214F4DCE|nr:E3 ubiquitin-protein ligase listerin [Pectinophora gossypiella]
MGGKSKQAQRTKNNVRPSSSGRSAEQLCGLAGTGMGLGGTTLFPSLAVAVQDAMLSTDFALCFKKLNKKDPVTKAKALQELTELVQNSKADDVVAALPCWTHAYRALAVESDRKVRELTQACHGAVCSASGRRLAPQLRALLPVWLTAQYDDHAPAMARAQASLHRTFPENKLPDAISFCKEEILTHLIDNLLDPNAAIGKKAEGEERAAAAERVAAASLQGLRYVCGRLARAHDAWLWARLQPLLGAPAFWARGAHGAAAVRAAWYGTAAALAARAGAAWPGWAGAAGARLLRLLLGARESPAAGAAAARHWRALLQALHADPDWYERLEKKDALTKKIIETLESGGWGDARRLVETLLPLLALLPPALLTEEFYTAFFNACFVGFEKKSVVNCKSEREAWIAGVAECVRHVSQGAGAAGAGAAAGALRAWARAALGARGAARGPCARLAGAHMGALLRGWPGPLQAAAWRNLADVMLQQLDDLDAAEPFDADAFASLLDTHALFLRTLKTSDAQVLSPPGSCVINSFRTKRRSVPRVVFQPPKPRPTIRFEDEPETEEDPRSESSTPGDSAPPREASSPPETGDAPPTAAEEAAAAARYALSLQECAERVAARAVRLAAQHAAAAAAGRALPPLLEQFASRALLAAVGAALGAARPDALYHVVLLPWLRAPATRASPVLDLAFQLMRHLTEDERDGIYDTFEQGGDAVCEWAVCASAAHPACTWAAARRWLRGAAAARALQRCVGRAAGCAAARAALLGCLAAPPPPGPAAPAAGPLLDAAAAAAVLAALAQQLAADPQPRTAALAAQLAASLAAAAPPDGYRELLLALYELTLNRQISIFNVFFISPVYPYIRSTSFARQSWEVSPETLTEARGAWQDGLLALAPPLRDRLVDEMLRLREQYLQQSSEELDLSRVEHATSLCAYMVDPQGPAQEAAALLRRALPAAGEARAAALPLALLHDVVSGRLVCPAGLEAGAPPRAAQLRPLLRTLAARGVLLRGLARAHAAGAALLAAAPVRPQLLDLLHDYALLCSLKDGYAFWAHYEDIAATERQVGALLGDMVPQLPGAETRAVAAALAAAAGAGHYWAYARAHFARCAGGLPGDAAPDHALTGDGFFHAVQAEAHTQGDEESRLRALQLCALRALLAVLPPGGLGGPAPGLGGLAPGLGGPATELGGPEPGLGGRDALAALDALVDAHYRHPDNMLYDTDISSAPWNRVTWAAAALRLCAGTIAARGWDLAPSHWDFATISLASLLGSLHASRHSWGCAKVATVWVAAVQLLEAVAQFVEALPAQAAQRRPAPHVAALPAEWRHVFRAPVAAHLYAALLHVLENNADSSEMTSCEARVVSSLCRAVRVVRWEHAAGAAPGAAPGAPPLAGVAQAAARVLAAPAHHAYKYLAYHTLRQLADPLVLDDAEKLRAWAPAETVGEGDEEEEESAARPRFLLHYFHEPLLQLQEQVDAALAHQGGAKPEAAEEEPPAGARLDAREASAALGLLLLWDAADGCVRRARAELAAQYAAAARGARLAQRLLPAAAGRAAAAAAAAPHVPLRAAALRRRSVCAAPARSAAALALNVPLPAEPAGELQLQWLACRALFTGVSGVWAGCARAWRGAAEPREARALSRLVAAYVAPELVERQLGAVLARAAELEDADVGVHRSTREVWCVVRVEDSGVELRVWLGADHPLTPPRVEAPATRHSAAPATHWLAVYLAYQNGSVLNALKMWQRAVTARVDAAPQCYICYCRLQPGTGRLPSVPCRQCRNKFHNLCLRKWFSSSNKSNCPLCRATF